MQKNKSHIAGFFFTLLMTIFFIWIAWQWFHLYTIPEKTNEEMLAQSITACKNSKTLSEAQKKYIQKDYDGDGLNEYAEFYVHLWQSVNQQGEPVTVNLISKKLGFAMGPSKAIDGYYYTDIHERSNRQLDHTKEWAVLAAPVMSSNRSAVFFIADHSGHIYARQLKYIPTEIPQNLLSDGWVEVDETFAGMIDE